MPYQDLKGKVVVITGGAGGMGQAAARTFVSLGAQVLLVDFRESALQDAVSALETDQVTYFVADVTSEASVRSYAEFAIERFGRIDVLFNAAGSEGRIAPLIEYSLDDFRRVYEINVFGTFLALRHVLPHMYARGSGSVILVGSVCGLDENSRGTSTYDSSKAAITGLTQTAALESSDYGVRVNAIHPGPVDTGLMASIHHQRHPGTDPLNSRKRLESVIPLGRVGQPEDIANLVAFLSSDDSSWITGVNYRIDGGLGGVGRLTRHRPIPA
jgi:NAD(P)-dependent dehydrogenase (short-subunit alcohol dehydrogenase family)